MRNFVLSLTALALQPKIEWGKQSWPFASSLVVSFGSVNNVIRNSCECLAGHYGHLFNCLSIRFLGELDHLGNFLLETT